MIYNFLFYLSQIKISSNKSVYISIPVLFLFWITLSIRTYNYYLVNWNYNNKLLLFQNLICIYSIGLMNTIYYYIYRIRHLSKYSKVKLFLAIAMGNFKTSTDLFFFIEFIFQFFNGNFFQEKSNILSYEIIYNSFSFAIYILFDLLFLITLALPYTNDEHIVEQSILLNKKFFTSNAIIYLITIIFVLAQMGIYQISLFLKDYLYSIGFLQIITFIFLIISILLLNILKSKFNDYN